MVSRTEDTVILVALLYSYSTAHCISICRSHSSHVLSPFQDQAIPKFAACVNPRGRRNICYIAVLIRIGSINQMPPALSKAGKSGSLV